MASGSNVTVSGGTTMRQVVAGTDLVDDVDFNNMRTNINSLFGTAADVTLGSGISGSVRGWGQGGVGVGAASQGSTITRTGSGGFKDLQDDIQAMCAFLGVSLRSGVGTDVTTSTAISATTWNNSMLNIQDCWNDRFGPASRTTATADTHVQNFNWTGQVTCETTFTFASEAAARAYFNGGGRIGLSSSFAPDVTTDQNTQWQTKLSNFGDCFITHDSSSASAGTASGVGFYDLSTSYQQIAIYYGGATPYANDYVRVRAKVNSTTNPTVVTFEIVFYDADDNAIDAAFDGSFTVNGRTHTPDANGSGFSFTAPTANVGTMAQS